VNQFWKYHLDHILFWLATVGFHMFTKAPLIQRAGPEYFIQETIVRNALLAAIIYFNLLYLVPRFAHKGRIVLYTILLAATLAAYVLLKNAHDVYLYGYVLADPFQQAFFSNTYYNFSIAFFYLAFSVALHLSKEWYFQRELIRQMEIEKLNAELDYLKAQINPHFVFNSINTIYFQIDRQNEDARTSLSNFSEMLRYQLYECNGSEIPIEKELAYIKSYVALQQARKDGNYKITFTEGEDLKGFSISPLLLIPFIENSFKHVSHFSSVNEIKISLTRDQNNFQLTVHNTRDHRRMNGEHKGIGLANVRRRLELLYPHRHELTIGESPNAFDIQLTLRINDPSVIITRS